MNFTRRKGATLAELSVVLAVLAVVTAMVVSFAVLITQHASLSTARMNAINDIEQVKSVTKGWLNAVEQESSTALTADEILQIPGHVMSRKIGESNCFISFANGTLSARFPNGNTLSCSTTQVTGLGWQSISNETDTLYIFTLTYILPTADNAEYSVKSIVFCANPHTGDWIDAPTLPDGGDTDAESAGASQ